MHYREVWQAEWDGCSANKLHSVKPHLGYCSITQLSRRDAVILKRLRIGHTRITHKYNLSGNSQPLCNECQCSLTVKHISLECCSLKDIHEKYFTNLLLSFNPEKCKVVHIGHRHPTQYNMEDNG